MHKPGIRLNLSTATATAAVASVTLSPPAGGVPEIGVYIDEIYASYSSSTQSGALTITVGTTTFKHYIHSSDRLAVERVFSGGNVTVSLAAGGAGVEGSINVLWALV